MVYAICLFPVVSILIMVVVYVDVWNFMAINTIIIIYLSNMSFNRNY